MAAVTHDSHGHHEAHGHHDHHDHGHHEESFVSKYIFCEDIAKWIQSCKSMRVHIYPRGDEMIVYIHGSPPCQGFSAVNTSGGANDAQNNECTLTFLEAIQHLQPTFVSMENVPGMRQQKNSE